MVFLHQSQFNTINKTFAPKTLESLNRVLQNMQSVVGGLTCSSLVCHLCISATRANNKFSTKQNCTCIEINIYTRFSTLYLWTNYLGTSTVAPALCGPALTMEAC